MASPSESNKSMIDVYTVGVRHKVPACEQGVDVNVIEKAAEGNKRWFVDSKRLHVGCRVYR